MIAHDREKELCKSLERLIESAKAFGDRISVARVGIIAAEVGVSSMHDVTEEGCLEPYGNYARLPAQGRN